MLTITPLNAPDPSRRFSGLSGRISGKYWRALREHAPCPELERRGIVRNGYETWPCGASRDRALGAFLDSEDADPQDDDGRSVQ
jgi:hypothetical protein